MFLKKLKISQKMFLGFGIVTLLLLLVIGYSYVNFNKQRQAIEFNIHTYNTIKEADDLMISLVNMETGARGFAITGKKEFLEPFNQGKIDYKQHYENLKSLTKDNPVQQDRLNNLNDNYEIWLDFERDLLIDGRQKVIDGEYRMEDLIFTIGQGQGKNEMDNIRSILREVGKEEQNQLEIRRSKLIKIQKQTNIIMSTGGALATILAIFISLLVIRMIVKPVRTVTETFKEISEGDTNLETRLKESSSDELGDMARYFNKFMMKLKEVMLENIHQNWVKTGQNELSEKMSGEQDMLTLGNNIITYIAKYMNAHIGALYIKTNEDTFKLFGSYAYNKRKNLSNEVKISDGIIGQAAFEKQTIVISNVPDDYIKISSGLGEGIPQNILVTPCLYNNQVECIIELGAFHEFTDLQIKFFEEVNSSIAIAIHSTEARLQMKVLLDKTLQQAEELQAQQEELRQNNEELEEQTRALKESEAHLQSQQEELKVTNEELEERTKSLEQQRNDIIAKNDSLRNAQTEIEQKAKALEVASKYKSEFLANMSHELRTPLNSILVLSQLLEEKKDNTPLTDKQLEFAKTIHGAGQDLLKLINDILDLSKVEAGMMDINIEKFSISEITQYVERAFRPIANQKGLEFKIDIENDVPEQIASDSQRIQQIVNNLLSNAFKFTHSGGVTMNIKAIKKVYSKNVIDDTKSFIEITITDTGIGIPLNKQAIVFEAFKQSDGTTSRKYGGTGLGLSISKELARLIGGEIRLSSYEGKGSTFSLIIPVHFNDLNPKSNNSLVEHDEVTTGNFKEDEDAKLNSDSVINLSTTDSEGSYKNQKVLLIIEDDKNFSLILSDLAREKGYECLIAGEGSEGILLAKKYEPDAILLDIGLPDINGWKVIDKLKDIENTKFIPVHVISGSDDRTSIDKNSTVVSYLKKPVNLQTLNDVFDKILANISTQFKKILILDENKAEISRISKVFGERDITVTSSDNGAEGYNLIKKGEYDCIILDLKLKEMSGIELLSKLKEDNITNLTVIINTEEVLTVEDEAELQKYTESIIIKGTHSVERLVAEASLFLHDIDSKIEKNKIHAIKTSHEKENSLKNKKILIVDDDMRNVFALSSALEEKGIEVVIGRNGKEGIKKLSENSDINLILMDIMMPEMDGYTAMREIRKESKYSKIPIIAITAKAMKEDREKCIEAGASDYLTKPIDIDKLISLLRVWLYK